MRRPPSYGLTSVGGGPEHRSELFQNQPGWKQLYYCYSFLIRLEVFASYGTLVQAQNGSLYGVRKMGVISQVRCHLQI